MEEKDSELLVVRRNRDGRRRYDERTKLNLVEACLKPGISVARTAIDHGINPNLLRKWIARYLQEREQSAAPTVMLAQVEEIPSAFMSVVPALSPSPAPASVPVPVPVPIPTPAPPLAIGLHVRLPNGVQFDLGEAGLDELSSVMQLLSRLPCSDSTTR